MQDYIGDMNIYQKRLDEAGVDFDITTMAGAALREIQAYTDYLIRKEKERKVWNKQQPI